MSILLGGYLLSAALVQRVTQQPDILARHHHKMQVLVCDVRKCILQQYARSYAPWWGIACKQWQIESFILPEPDHAHNSRCDVLAREGRLTLLQSILYTNNRLYNEIPFYDVWKKRRLMEEAAKEGHVELLRWLHGLWQVTPDMWQIVMMVAARNNHEKVVRLCHKLCSPANMKFAMAGAARGGHERLVQLCYKEWVAATPAGGQLQDGIDLAMQEAARGGHESIVRLCHAWCTANLENTLMHKIGVVDPHTAAHMCVILYVSGVCDTLCRAARGGHASIVNLCYQWLAANVTRMTAYATRTIDPDTVMIMCKERTINTANDAMKEAAKGGHEHVVRLCHDHYHATDVDEAMAQAAWCGQEHIVRMCHDEWGATNANRAMMMAAWHGHEKIVRLCHDEYNATDVTAAMHRAADDGHDHIVRLCYEWGARNLRQVQEEALKKEHGVTLKLGFNVTVCQSCDNKGCGILQGRKRVVALCHQWLMEMIREATQFYYLPANRTS